MENNDRTACPCEAQDAGVSRRTVLAAQLLLATGFTAAARGAKAADEDLAVLPPQTGDLLVHATGEHKGEPVGLADFGGEEPLIQAWAKDPESGVVRSKSRLHRVLLLRLGSADFDERTAERAADGVVAYSDFCTHAGCFIENFRVKEGAIYCHCHGSMFDPKASARVLVGPAKQPLAGLPLKVDGDRLLVAGPFEGRLGMPKV